MTTCAKPVRLAALDCLTPFGDAATTHEALVAGRSALSLVPLLGSRGGEPVPLALLPGRVLDETVPPAWITQLRRLVEPVRGGGWGSPRRPVCFASSNFGVGSLYGYLQDHDTGALRTCTPERSVAWLRGELGWGPHGAVFSHACVSAHIALLHASRLLSAGAADEVLVFSYDFLSPFVAGGFHALKILNGAMPAPYETRETGAIGLGDGAGYAVLARDRGDLEISAQCVHNEMHHVTSNDPSGAGFDAVLAGLGVSGRRLWFKGHGTGTLEAGRLECSAVARLMPDAPIVGWKGALGHTLGSCGMVELAVAAQALRRGLSPGTVNSRAPAFVPQVALDPFDNRAYDGVICSSNAFGGAHASLVLSHA